MSASRPVMTTVPVFLSSTWLDLQPERAKVEAVLNQFRETKFKGMEYFGSRPDGAAHVSLDEVERCLVYIGVFGGRYGSGITEAEYRRARARGLACLVYLKKTPTEADTDETASAHQRALLAELRSNRDHLVKEFSTADDLATMVAIDLHYWLFEQYLIPYLGTTITSNATIRDVTSLLAAVVDRLSLGGPLLRALKAGGYSIEDSGGSATQPGTETARHQLATLAQRVRQAWIAGVLDHTVHNEMMLSIGRQLAADAVDRPWSTQTEIVVSDVSVQIPHELSTLKVFGQAGRFLLVLGNPGSGKTVTLLELTRDLLDLYDNGQLPHVPVVLNLSTWRPRAGGMVAWATEELVTTYFLPRPLARHWIEGRRLILILDGLDEVTDHERASCVHALNEFLAEVGAAGVAVACRTAEYAALTPRLRLYSAIRLQPLDDEQVDSYLARGGEPLAVLRATLRVNEGLRVLSRTPLMLAIMGLALQGLPELVFNAAEGRATESQLRNELFAQYTSRMFKRRRMDDTEQREMTRQLSWLASGMQQHGMSVFWIERLQPTWLGSAAWKIFYAVLAGGGSASLFSVASMLGIVWGLPKDSMYWAEAWRDLARIALSLAAGTSIVDVLRLHIVPRSSLWASQIVSKVLSASWLALYFLLPSFFMARQLARDVPIVTISIGFTFWLAYGCRYAWRRADTDVRVTDELSWSWPHALRGAMVGVLIGGLFEAAIDAALPLYSAVTITSFLRDMRDWVSAAVDSPFVFLHSLVSSWTAIGWAALGAGVFGLKRMIRERTIRPNEGLRQTARRTLGYQLFFTTILFGCYFITGEESLGRAAISFDTLGFLLFVGTIVGTLFGGLDVVKHCALRLLLAAAGHFPLRAVLFLNHGVSLVFLQRVGGGYVFIHRMLLEYFAELPVGVTGTAPGAAGEDRAASRLRSAGIGSAGTHWSSS